MTSKRAVRLAYAPDGGSRSQLRLQSPQLSPARAWGGFAPGETTADPRTGGVGPFAALLDRRHERAEGARKRTEPERDGCANCGHSHRSIIVVLTTAMSVTAMHFVMYICVANPLDSAQQTDPTRRW